MKRLFEKLCKTRFGFIFVLLLIVTSLVYSQNTAIYKDQGGSAMTIGSGGTLTIASGGTLSVASGGIFSAGSGTIANLTVTYGVSAATMVVSNTGASALDVAGGINAGTGNVGIVDATGKIPALSSTYLANLSGANLTSLTAANISAGVLPATVQASSIALAGFYSSDLVRTNLGLAIGTDVQAYDADLADLADGSLTGSKVGSGVPAANIASGFLGASVICSSVTESVIAEIGTVAAGNITAGTMGADVIASSIAVDAVESANIKDGEIVDADINNSAAIAISKLATSGSLGANVICSSIAIGAVENDALAGNIADSKLNQITTADKVAAGAIVAGSLGASVIASSVAIGAVGSDQLAGSIPDSKLNTIATAGKVNAAALTGSIPIGTGPYQSSDCEALTPTAEGQWCYDTTAHKLNISTVAALGGFAPLALE